MPIEAQCRKECFDEATSAPVVLADGQTWWLPKPWLEIRPTFRGGRSVGAYPVLTYGRELDELLDAVGKSDDGIVQIGAVAGLGAYLLRQQYRLDDQDLDELLCFRVGDEASEGWACAVMDVATGRSGPKVSSAGGD
jgi:hypothetical protein